MTTHGAHATAPTNQQPQPPAHNRPHHQIRKHPSNRALFAEPDRDTRIPAPDLTPATSGTTGDNRLNQTPAPGVGNVTSEPARSPAADTSGAATQDARVHYAVHKQQTATSPTRHQTPPPSPKPHGPGSDGSRYGEDRHRPQGTKPNRARSLRTQQCAQTTKPRHSRVPTPTTQTGTPAPAQPRDGRYYRPAAGPAA